MDITVHSKNNILKTFADWDVPRDFADPMFNYLVWGFQPGSFFTSVLANDFIGAIRRSHPSNTLEAKKALAGWIVDTVPSEARGSYELVESWCDMTSDLRRPVLEKHGLIFTEAQEIMLTLKGSPTHEPMLY